MIRVFLWAYRLAALAYPRRFRAQFGHDMRSANLARLGAARSRGLWRAFALGVWLCTDAVLSGLAERRSPSSQPAAIASPRSQTMTVESILNDARLAIRRLRAAPAFAAATVATLGIGIGATTAIFSVANAVLLQPLPYGRPDQLVAIWSNNTHQNVERNPVSPADFEGFRAAPAFAGVEAAYSFLVNAQVVLPSGLETVASISVTPGLFDLIGRPALHGRVLRKGDDTGVLLSFGFWKRVFGADPRVIGTTVRIPGLASPYEIVGVMPADFVFPYKSMLGSSGFIRASSADIWQLLPMTAGQYVDATGQPSRTIHFLTVIGRLRPGETLERAQAQLQGIAERRGADFKDTNDGWSATMLPLHEQVVGRVRPAVVLLFSGVALLLLMTSLNIANVLLARATGRHRDLAVRTALGASSGRLIQQALVESVVLAVCGAIVGAVVVLIGVPIIVALAPADLPRLSETTLSWPVLVFAVLLTGVTSLTAGVLPAIASRRAGVAGLQESHRTTWSPARQRVRALLVVAEVAVATVLTVGTGLLVRSFVAVIRVNPGFEVAHVLTFQENVPPRANSPAARIAFLDEMDAKLGAIPGVTRVGGTTRIPLGSTQVTTQLTVEGHDVPTSSLPEVDMRRAVGDYFQAMGIPVVQGRVFEPADRAATQGLALANAALVRQIFKDEPVIGRRVKMGPPSPTTPWLTIVGVVGDIRHNSLEDEPRPEIYISHLQGPPSSPFVAMRVSGDPSSVLPAVRNVMRELGADPPYNVNTLMALRSESLALRRFTLVLAVVFGVLALLLAAVGIYGVTALVVAERTGEVGVRMALGATPSRILTMIVSEASRIGLLGIAIGLGGGFAVAQLARNLLFSISPIDLLTFVAAPCALWMVTIIASFLPARRATRIPPVTAIRS